MKRVVRSLLLFFCTTLFMLSESVCVCVVRVYADNPTYWVVPLNASDGAIGSDYLYQSYGSGEGRAIVTHTATKTNIFVVSTSSDLKYSFRVNGTYRNNNPYASAKVVNGILYYFYLYNVANAPSLAQSCVDNGFPYVATNDTSEENLVYYTYGDGAVAPAEPVDWGLIDLEGYQTQVAGQGNSAINNVDVISWNDTFDTNSNDISTGNVRVRYVPGYYRATSKQNLLAQTYQDFVLDIISAVNGDVYPVSNGSASFRWGDVIGSLSIPFYSIYNLTNSTEGWLKRGWIYEVRLEIDDYIGEWQTVYSSTSSGVENDMTIVNTTVITQDTITAIQNINSINDTTNIWIIYGQPVDPNPEVTPPADDDEKPWWVYLLEMINNTLGIQNEYINEGTDESIEVVNNFEEDHDDLNVTVNDYDDIENNIVDDMNDNLDDLDIESDLIENNSFLSSARWVAEQYTRITTDNPIGSILKFSLVLGFIMIFLGRFK